MSGSSADFFPTFNLDIDSHKYTHRDVFTPHFHVMGGYMTGPIEIWLAIPCLLDKYAVQLAMHPATLHMHNSPYVNFS